MFKHYSKVFRPVRSDLDNRKPLTNTVLLTTRTVLCTKSTKLFEPWLNHPNLRTMNGSHGSDQRFLKKNKIKFRSSQHLITMVEVSTTMRCYQTLKILRSHHPSLASSVSRLFSVQNFFFLNLLLFLSLSCFPTSTPSRCCVNWFKKTKER